MTIFVKDLISTLTKPYGNTDKPHKMTSKEIELIQKLICWDCEWDIVKQNVSSEFYFCTSADETIIGPFIYIYSDEDSLPFYLDVAKKTIGEDKMMIVRNQYNDSPIVVYTLELTDE